MRAFRQQPTGVKLAVAFCLVVVLGVLCFLPSIQAAREAGRYAGDRASLDYYSKDGAAPAAAADGVEGVTKLGLAVNGYFAGKGIGSGDTFVAIPQDDKRKIIYNGHVEVAVEDFTGVPDRVLELVKQFGAYVADSTTTGSKGETRRGTWKLRVPVARFEEFFKAAKGLGELVTSGISSRDVSEEFYDVEARIRNKTKEEERLLKLLEERPGKLEDVIAIERELSRVREELERMQGRMRVLADLTTLTTVDLTVVEIKGYQPAESPTLAIRARRALEQSLTALRTGGEDLLVAAVAAAPWLGLLAIVGVPGYFAARRVVRRLFVPVTAAQPTAGA